MKKALAGFIVLVLIIISVILVLKKQKEEKSTVLLPSPSPSIEQRIENKFTGISIPEDSQKIELKDVSGGENFGIVTDTEILANLQDLPSGQVYKVWLEKEGKTTFIGNLEKAKGGYLLKFSLSQNEGYDKIIVTQNSKHILEGSF